MSNPLVCLDTNISEEEVTNLVGEYIHVTENHHGPEGETENIWFAGQVAGYEKATLKFDYLKQEFMETPSEFFNVLMTDGAGYVLSKRHLEIHTISKEEFDIMLTEHLAKQAMEEEAEEQIKKVIQFPEKKIILPGEF